VFLIKINSLENITREGNIPSLVISKIQVIIQLFCRFAVDIGTVFFFWALC